MSQSPNILTLEGKASTQDFWNVHRPILICQTLGLVMILALSGSGRPGPKMHLDLYSDWGLALAALMLIPLWPQIAIASQRLADRGKPKFWLFLFFAPSVHFWLTAVIAGLPAAFGLALKLSVFSLMIAAWYYYELGFMPSEGSGPVLDTEPVKDVKTALFLDPDEAITRAITELKATADAGKEFSDRRYTGPDRRVGASDTRANPVERRSGSDRRAAGGFGRRGS